MTKGFALIGAGLFGERHAQAYSRHHAAKLIAICDLDATRAEEIAARYGAERYTTTLDDILAHPEIAAVSIATPDHLHRDVAVACANAGKHLLIEKPLATTVADATAIIEAARRTGVKLMVDFHNRVNPPFVNAREAIKTGAIGEPRYLYARLSNTLAVPQTMLRWAKNSSALWFLSSHMVDIVRWLVEDEVHKVYAVERKGVLQARGLDVPDFHVATVEFRGGSVAVFEHAWILPNSYATVKDLKLEILGSEGAIHVDGSHHRALEIYGPQQARFPDVFAPPTGDHLTGFVLDGIAHFVDSIVFDTPLLATGEDGLAVTRIITALLTSSQQGSAVYLSDISPLF